MWLLSIHLKKILMNESTVMFFLVKYFHVWKICGFRRAEYGRDKIKQAKKRKAQVCFTLLHFGKLVLSELLQGYCILIASILLRRLWCSQCVDNLSRNSYVSFSWAIPYEDYLIQILSFVERVFQIAFLSARNIDFKKVLTASLGSDMTDIYI